MSPSTNNLPDGWFTPADVEAYRRLVSKVPSRGTIAELGVWRGRSLCSIADLVIAKKLRVVAVDSFAGTEPQYEEGLRRGDVKRSFLAALEQFGLSQFVALYECTTDEAAGRINEELDLVFVDAEHRHEQVARDIANWTAKLKLGGTIAGHDYDEVEPAVTRVLPGCHYVDGRIWISHW